MAVRRRRKVAKQEGAERPPLATPTITNEEYIAAQQGKSLQEFYCASCRKLVGVQDMLLNEEGYYNCKQC